MTITASEARRDLFPLIKKVNDDHAPVRISSKSGNAVLMSEEDYEAWQETMFLLRSRRNAERLMRSIAEMDAGGGTVRDLIEVEDD
ncbi:type II toxin-antitoxin system Phd/YefM family antitoxin [Glycomyces terrestris]|uniref:Antitoxin n=1 Tax=Glycomyces terrestris TaxID=2493553 RepID=A0A426V032_9ACTN|nr:type II toxin-antitoxin system prevent-host-death family antitoxin [Glycomyces terrestris]RRS00238.1 type II toxin-antitoxin system prevent-host-death family antitoxin [Glycomyces terrestris]